MKKGRLSNLFGGVLQSSEISQEWGESHSGSKEGRDLEGGFYQELSIRPGSSLIANATIPSRNSWSMSPKKQHIDSSEPMGRSGPEMSNETTEMTRSLPQTSPVQADSQLRPADNLSNNRQSTPVQVNPTSGALPDQQVSLIMQEVNELRAQMSEVVRRQQLEANRESRSPHITLNEGDDSRMAPPAYSDGGF